MSVERKRRAIYTVLSEVVEGHDLWQVMWCWQKGYADKSQFELNGFLSACSHLDAIARNRSSLYRKLISSMMLAESALKADPIADMQAYADEVLLPVADSAEYGDDWSPLFTQVVTDVFAQLRSDTATSVSKYAQEQAGRHQLNAELSYAFTLWKDNRKPMQIEGVPLKALRQLLNYIYIGLCEGLGPVEADRILSTAVNSRARHANLDARDLL